MELDDKDTELQKAVQQKAQALHRSHARAMLEQAKPADRSDLIFVGSFVGAAIFGIANGINTIRHGFYESFVKPPTHVLDLTRMNDAEAAKAHPFADLFRARKRDYQKSAQGYNAGKGSLSGVEMAREKIDATMRYSAEIDERLIKDFGIHTKGVRGWTTDIWKQRRHTGVYARRAAVFTMATTSVVTLGAIATLKYSKHLLDLMDKQESKDAPER